MQAILADLTDPDNIFGHLSYIFLIASMMMTSLRNLRILALCSGLAAMAHFLLRTQDNVSLAWEVIFTLTNAAQLALLLYRSRRLELADEEQALVGEALDVGDPAQSRQLLGVIEWRDIEVGEVLMEQGHAQPPLLFVARGAAGIEHDGRLVGVCGRGDFLGEMSMISGEPASATVRATNRMRVARFDTPSLAKLMESSPDMRNAMMLALNRGLAAKVLRMNRGGAAIPA